ncbi:PREDICTED: PDZK1-interacting protein 1 isoform X2 [Capra hircus]|nr:PREDICTED: PDZK1-interacting protein 1 isoform X2 [Capra hircus]
MRVKPDRADLSGRPQDPQQLQGPRFQPPEQVPAAMSALSLVVLSLLTAMPPASCQRAQGNLQPWMQGLIAVAVFLVLVAIAFAVNHFWCQEEPASINTVMTIGNTADGILVGTDGKYSSMAASFRSSEHENAYENIPEEEGKVHSTPM